MSENTEPSELVERDVNEVANQLLGYIDTTTEDALAKFLIREGNEAAKLARRIQSQQAQIEQMREELEKIVTPPPAVIPTYTWAKIIARQGLARMRGL